MSFPTTSALTDTFSTSSGTYSEVASASITLEQDSVVVAFCSYILSSDVGGGAGPSSLYIAVGDDTRDVVIEEPVIPGTFSGGYVTHYTEELAAGTYNVILYAKSDNGATITINDVSLTAFALTNSDGATLESDNLRNSETVYSTKTSLNPIPWPETWPNITPTYTSNGFMDYSGYYKKPQVGQVGAGAQLGSVYTDFVSGYSFGPFYSTAYGTCGSNIGGPLIAGVSASQTARQTQTSAGFSGLSLQRITILNRDSDENTYPCSGIQPYNAGISPGATENWTKLDALEMPLTLNTSAKLFLNMATSVSKQSGSDDIEVKYVIDGADVMERVVGTPILNLFFNTRFVALSDTLSAGDHTIDVYYRSGTTTATIRFLHLTYLALSADLETDGLIGDYFNICGYFTSAGVTYDEGYK